MRILMVDDDLMVRAIVSMVLEDAGYDVAVAASAEEALELIPGDPRFDLIISDLHMPGINGIELFGRLRGSGFTAPFILLSGDDPAKLRNREPRIDTYLIKDETLEDTIAQAVAKLITVCEDRKPMP